MINRNSIAVINLKKISVLDNSRECIIHREDHVELIKPKYKPYKKGIESDGVYYYVKTHVSDKLKVEIEGRRVVLKDLLKLSKCGTLTFILSTVKQGLNIDYKFMFKLADLGFHGFDNEREHSSKYRGQYTIKRRQCAKIPKNINHKFNQVHTRNIDWVKSDYLDWVMANLSDPVIVSK